MKSICVDWNEEREEKWEGRRDGTGSKGWQACGEEFGRKKKQEKMRRREEGRKGRVKTIAWKTAGTTKRKREKRGKQEERMKVWIRQK